MNLRALLLALASLGIPLALATVALPMTWGYAGFSLSPEPNGSFQLRYVAPGGPAARAGLHKGDVILPLKGWDEVHELGGSAGSIVQMRVVRGGSAAPVNVTFVPFYGPLEVQETVTKIAGAVTAMLAYLVVILVLLRARDMRLATRAATALLFAGSQSLSISAALVAGDALLAHALNTLAPPILGASALWAGTWLLAIFPPVPSRVREWTLRLGWLPLTWVCLRTVILEYDALNGTVLPLTNVVSFDSVISYAISLAVLTIPTIAILDGLHTATGVYRVPMRWLGGMWLVAIASIAIPFAVGIAGSQYLLTHNGDIIRFITTFFLTFGVAYPVLRHRLVDLNLVVSRATIFAAVSLIIVGLFVAAEWVIVRVFEQSSQVITLLFVLVLGISARWIHRFVDERLSKLFFRNRLRAIAEIERVARESDAATDAQAVLNLAVDTVAHALEPAGVAIYVRGGRGYERSVERGQAAFAPDYDYNDAQPLRLRRWQEPFQLEDDAPDSPHELFVPMMVRGELLGFLRCAPKRDHTLYAADEIAALSLLAHHAGLAFAWLGRAPIPRLEFGAALQHKGDPG